MKNVICGKIVAGGEIKNILKDIDFDNGQETKELFFANEFNEVDSFLGFEGLDIVEVDPESEMADRAIEAIQQSNGEINGIIFTSRGFLFVTDIMFFEAFFIEDGKEVMYSDIVVSNTYDEDVTEELLENEVLL